MMMSARRVAMAVAAVALAALSGAAQGTLEIQVATFTGRTNNRPVTVAPLQQPFVWVDTNSTPARTNVVWGGAVTVYPTNGVAEVRLAPANYRISFEGLNTNVLFAMPQTTGRVSLVELSATNLWWMTNLVSGGGGGTFDGWTNVLLTARVLWVDGVSGDDGTARREDPTRAWETVSAAATNAVEGDTVVVLAGAYLADGIGTNLVNWVLEGGVEIASEYPVFTLTNATVTISGSGVVTNTAGGSAMVLENATVVVEGVTIGGRIELIGTNNVLTLRDCVVQGPRDWLLGGEGNDVRFFGAESAYICTNTAPSIVGTLGVRR